MKDFRLWTLDIGLQTYFRKSNNSVGVLGFIEKPKSHADCEGWGEKGQSAED